MGDVPKFQYQCGFDCENYQWIWDDLGLPPFQTKRCKWSIGPNGHWLPLILYSSVCCFLCPEKGCTSRPHWPTSMILSLPLPRQQAENISPSKGILVSVLGRIAKTKSDTEFRIAETNAAYKAYNGLGVLTLKDDFPGTYSWIQTDISRLVSAKYHPVRPVGGTLDVNLP